MRPFRIPILLFAAMVLILPPLYAKGEEPLLLTADGGPAVEKTARTRNLSLMVPQRFFRAKGESGFSTPYIALLHYRLRGETTWREYGLFKDLDKPIDFTADSEGAYEFFVMFADQKGNPDVTPTSDTVPHFSVLFDWTPPKVTLDAPRGGELIGSSDAFEITWTASDAFPAETPVTLEASLDGGLTWETIAAGLDNSGSYPWRPASSLDARAVVRVTVVDEVGHSSAAVSRSPVVIDTTAPKAQLHGPMLSSAGTVDLEVTADDGHGTGVETLLLWSTLDNGATWSPAGSVSANSPLVFNSSTGRFGLMVTAVDKAGNESPKPKPGQAPQLVLTIDTRSPIVRLKTLVSGGHVKGGATVPVEWVAVGPSLVERPVSIFMSPDGGNTWAKIVSDVANTGTVLWEVPKINSRNCLLKIVVKDAIGTLGADTSAKPFTVDSTRPTSAIGIAPVVSGPLGDLGTVMRPVPVDSGARQETSAPKADMVAVETPVVPEAAPVGDAAPLAASGMGASRSGLPETTPPLDEPWTDPASEAKPGMPGSDAGYSELIIAAEHAYKAGQLTIAKEFYARAVGICPDEGMPHAALGRIYAQEGSFNYTSRKQAFEAALYEFETAISLSGETADVLNDMGFVYLQTRRLGDAAQAFTRATELGDRAVYWYNLGLTFYEQGEFAAAAGALTKALESEPDNEDASFLMGDISARAGQWGEAKKHYTMAVRGYGPESDIGKLALSGIQKAREMLGEVEAIPVDTSLRQKLDRIR